MANGMTKESSEHGAVLVHTALALLALMAFSVFAIDFGVLWTSRRQAQNAADAGALAGAVAIAVDGEPASDGGVAEDHARTVAQQNAVWGQSPSLLPADVTFPLTTPCTTAEPCVRVDVIRSAARSNALPMFFGQLVGLTQQDVQATATAQIKIGNASPCLRPFAVPDLYTENSVPPDGEFSAGDTYTPLGYTLADVGTELLVKGATPGAQPRLAPGWFRIIDLDNIPAGGASKTWEAMVRCVGNAYSIGGVPALEQTGGETGKVRMGAEDLVDLDPTAWYDRSLGRIVDSCVDHQPVDCRRYDTNNNIVADPTATVSPRVIALPIFDPEAQWAGGALTGPINIVNILGFFLCKAASPCDQPPSPGPGRGGGPPGGSGTGGIDLRGIIVQKLDSAAGAGGPSGNASFLKVITLIR